MVFHPISGQGFDAGAVLHAGGDRHGKRTRIERLALRASLLHDALFGDVQAQRRQVKDLTALGQVRTRDSAQVVRTVATNTGWMTFNDIRRLHRLERLARMTGLRARLFPLGVRSDLVCRCNPSLVGGLPLLREWSAN